MRWKRRSPWSSGTSTCSGGECREEEWADSGANMKGRGGLMVMLVQGEGWGCSITSALMTSPEFKVGRATDGEVEERREEEGGGPSPSARPVRASVEIK